MCLVAIDFSSCVRPETIPRTLTDYQRLLTLPYRLSALALTAVALFGCSPAEDAPAVDRPRPVMIVSGQLENKDIVEASGLARSQRDPGILWTLNDGGSKPRLYAIDQTGAHRGRIKLEGVRNRDWEDIASFTLDGEPYLLVADIGDNDKRRKKVSFYVVAEPDLGVDGKVRLGPSWSVDYRYPDGPRDAEAVAVDVANERVIVLTKRNLPPVLYEVPLRPGGDGTVTATRLGAIGSLPRPRRQDVDQAPFTKDFHWQPTGMDLSPDGSLAAILTYRAVYVFHLEPGVSLYDSLSGQAYALGLGNFRDAESVAFSADSGSIFITVERRHAPLLRIDLNGALPE
jgi:hypothetical protein